MRRRLHIAILATASGAVPGALLVTIAPSCGSEDEPRTTFDANDAARDGVVADTNGFSTFDTSFVPPPQTDAGACGTTLTSHIVEIPAAGTPAEPGALCAVSAAVASSNVAARVTFASYAPATHTAKGFIALPAAIAPNVIGLPTISIVAASSTVLSAMTTSAMTANGDGYEFNASWPNALDSTCQPVTQMTVKVTFVISCDNDAGGGGATTKTIEAITKIDLCIDPTERTIDLASSGDTCCTDCVVIAEMAPSPIVSESRGDDLPLGHVLRLRVVELARAGHHVLLLAENDAGDDAKYEWRIEGGSLLHIADDVMLWTLPAEDSSVLATTPPFGQVAVWNEHGAAVENFLWSRA